MYTSTHVNQEIHVIIGIFVGMSSPHATLGNTQDEITSPAQSAALGSLLPGLPPLHPAPTHSLNQSDHQQEQDQEQLQHEQLQQTLIQQATGALFKQYHNYY